MISAVVLTRNEEANIGDCLERLGWCDEVLVIDDNSTDQTREIAKKKGARVFVRALNKNFASQRNFGLNLAKEKWVFFVDADERVSLKLAEEIKKKISQKPKTNGFFLKRIDFFMGKQLNHGETAGIKILRLGKAKTGKWERRVDERWRIKGKTATLKNPLLHYAHPKLESFLTDINERSALNAQVFFEERRKLTFSEWVKPWAKFLVNFFVKLGFLDQSPGFVFAVLMSLHSFLVRGKLYLLYRRKK